MPPFRILIRRLHDMMYGTQKDGSSRGMYLSAGCAWLVALSFGYVIGYSSPAIPDMEKNSILAAQGSALFGALMTVGGVVGCPLAGWTVEKLGRKLTLLLTCLPLISGWIFIACSYVGFTSTSLYIGRFFTGLGSGMTTVVTFVYVAETAPKELRGSLGSGMQFGITVGILVVYALGLVFGWRGLAIIGISIPLVAAVLALRIPETPRWYLMRGRKAEAIRALQWLRGSMDVDDEALDIEESLPEKTRVKWSDLLKPEIFRPLQVAVGLMVLQQFTGINAVMFYTVFIFESAGFKDGSGLATVVIGAVQVVATVVAVYLMDRAGRRTLLFIAGAIMTCSCFTMGLYYHWNGAPQATALMPPWVALVSLICYIIGFSLGWGPIPGLVMSEVFPVKVRGMASAIACIGNWGSAYVITRNFSWFVGAFGQAVTFWAFGVFTVVASVFVFIFVPETMGKSIEDIELFFLGRASRGM